MNPIQKNIAAGMSPIAAVLTEATCGEACWHAREEICRCSCGGKNHGCLKTADGERPVRTAKIQGIRFELLGVGDQWELHQQAVELNKAGGVTFYYADSSTNSWDADIPAKLRKATKAQLTGWPELKAHLEQRVKAAKTASCLAALDDEAPWPYLLWRRIEQK